MSEQPKPRVYVAGKLDDGASAYIRNLHRMIRSAERVRQAGFAVFVPGLDFLMGLTLGTWHYADYFENSQPWLDAADAVFVVPEGQETSKGTASEVKRAEAAGIPVFAKGTFAERLGALKAWRRLQDD